MKFLVTIVSLLLITLLKDTFVKFYKYFKMRDKVTEFFEIKEIYFRYKGKKEKTKVRYVKIDFSEEIPEIGEIDLELKNSDIIINNHIKISYDRKNPEDFITTPNVNDFSGITITMVVIILLFYITEFIGKGMH